jgi:hypothetical protein
MSNEIKQDEKALQDAVIDIANKLWRDLKERILDEPEFVKKSDSEKVDIYQKSEFKEFYINYPIVCRYMICMGQFSNKAFKRYLLKCKSMSTVKHTENHNAEDEWIQRQSDYIRYLWESYQKQNFNEADAQAIWQQSYKTLTQEFTDFKKLHKEVEAKLKVDDEFNKSSMVKELLQRLANEEQSLDSNTTTALIKKLEDKLVIQRKNAASNQIDKGAASNQIDKGAASNQIDKDD